MGTAAEEAGWTSLLLPLLFFTVSSTVLMLLSWQTISNRVTYSPFQKRLLQLMLVWAVIRTLSFFFRSLVSLVPYLGDNAKFVSFTRVMLSVGGAPLTRVVTKNCLTSFLGIKIFPRSQSSRFQAWNQSVSARKLAVSRTQACLDAILLTAMVFLVFSTIAYEVEGQPMHARWAVLVKLCSLCLFTCLNMLPLCGSVFALVLCECDGRLKCPGRILRTVLALTLVQSTLLVIRYAYITAYFLATVKFPVQFVANETQLYLCSLVPVFLMAIPFCLEWVVAMFQLDIVDERDITTRETVHFGVATDMVAQAALSAIS
ncbi:hypothetical protein BJ741DRAFT_703496 [Chytriomyces cf. hyalinus JEL632]|nr:hypothetical protein BJ741DRAFT_703496 [Chytriomyces cf. hyalinus JEL632]